MPITDESVARDESDELAVLHLECADCGENFSCFVAYASRRTPIEAVVDGVCAYCDHAFSEGQPILTESFLVVGENEELADAGDPDNEVEEFRLGRKRPAAIRRASEAVGTAIARGGNVVAAAGRAIPKGVSGRFSGVSGNLQQRMARAGLGKVRGLRTTAEAAEFYTHSIPRSVRNLGEVAEFLKGKTASHIESVANSPAKAKLSSNIIWERAADNLRRGANNMRSLELWSIRARNFADASRIIGRRMAGGATKGAIWAVVLEAPVSATENLIHLKKGRKLEREAAKDFAIDTAKAGVTGAAVGGAMVFAVAMGGGAILAPIALPMTAAGLSVYGISSVVRIRRALSDENEDMTETDAAWVDLAFHVECVECDSAELCHDAFLRGVAASAV